MTAARTPKRRRRIGYQGKRKTPGTGGGPKLVADVARDRARSGWLGRAKKNAPDAGPYAGSMDVGVIGALLKRLAIGRRKRMP